MKTIIAPTDFTTVSENACIYAANLAADINAELVLLHVMELPVPVAEYPVPESMFDEDAIEEELQRLKTKLIDTTQANIKISTICLVGSTEHQLRELCKSEQPFAVVIATHNYNALIRFFSGSTTVYSAKHLNCPVIIVPHNVKYKPVKKIAFASDLRDVYNISVPEIEKIVRLFDADLEVFYAGQSERAINSASIGGSLLAHRLLSIRPVFYNVQSDDVLLGVMSLVKSHHTDLLLILPKKHGPFHKSQTKDFIQYADVPLMAIHEEL